jgi:dTDP-glucose pyrophosphorylase
VTWKGLIVAGGTGTRLAPLTRVVNKHLLPVFDKPMIYYPLTTLMLADIREITVVTTPESVEQFVALLGDGTQWGLRLTYKIQRRPDGIAGALLTASDQLRGHNLALVLGDNIFFGAGFAHTLQTSRTNNAGATIFGYEVADPSAFGVVTVDSGGRPVAIEEKPARPTSRIAVTGLYLYGRRVACPEEIAYRRGFIDHAGVSRLAENAPPSDYKNYLLRVLEDPSIELNGPRDHQSTAAGGPPQPGQDQSVFNAQDRGLATHW